MTGAPSPRIPPGSHGPLHGVRILELATVAAGPTACQVMADFGADVVKIEHPRGGDEIRRNGDAKGADADIAAAKKLDARVAETP